MFAVLASCAAGGALLLAAAVKLADRPAAQVALGTYGIGGRAAGPALAALVAVEVLLGALVVAGSRPAALAAGALLVAFAAAQAGAVALGRAGAPCGCLGGRGRVSIASALRALALAALAVAAAVAGSGGEPRLWAPALVAAVVAAGLYAGRRAPDGALDVAGEGPPVGEPAPPELGSGPRVLLFTADGCRLCGRVRRGLARSPLALPVVELEEERDASAWLAANVPGAPYAVVLGADGTVQAKGTVNTAAQVRTLAGAAPSASSRRGFLERTATAAATVVAADTVNRLVRPGEAEAYHFCGHIYTTDSCPHPTGLPRIDARGLPLRASDGHPVDDLGRLIDAGGNAVDEDGVPLVDPDGRRLPRAPRTAVCAAVGRERGFRVHVDGAWYRCCGGSVRKLVDCCSENPRRINGDRALRGYCYKRRKVFCVMYFQTRVPC